MKHVIMAAAVAATALVSACNNGTPKANLKTEVDSLSYEMGLASAQAWCLFVIVCVLTVIAFASQKKWVYYSDEDGR